MDVKGSPGVTISPVYPRDLESLVLKKSPGGRVLLAGGPDDDWELSGPSQHEVCGTVGDFLRRALLDLRHRVVMADKIRHLLQCKIAELEAHLYAADGPLFTLTVWDASCESSIRERPTPRSMEAIAHAPCSGELALPLRYYRLSARPAGLASRLRLLRALPECAAVGASHMVSLDIAGFADFLRSPRCRGLLVLCGAGISTSLGLLDYRSGAKGLFAGLSRPEDVFSIDHFLDETPLHHYRALRTLWVASPRHPDHQRLLYTAGALALSPAHRFLSALAKHSALGPKLLRVYTQNVDGLEQLAGVPADRLVALHGGCARCSLNCGAAGSALRHAAFHEDLTADIGEFESALFAEDWEDAISKLNVRYREEVHGERLRRLREESSGGDDTFRAYLKPDVVLYGQAVSPHDLHLAEEDLRNADALLILGTSLRVAPFSRMVAAISPDAPRLLLNRELVGVERRYPDEDEAAAGTSVLDGGLRVLQDPRTFGTEKAFVYRDVAWLGEVDDGVAELAAALGVEL